MTNLRQPHTPGPWRFSLNPKRKSVELSGGERRFDISVMTFVRYGFSNGAPCLRQPEPLDMNIMHRIEHYAKPLPSRKHHEDWFQVIEHPDAQLIEAAPAFAVAWQFLTPAGVATVFDGLRQRKAEWAVEAIKRAMGESQ